MRPSGALRNLQQASLAERGGFEPPIRLPVCRISSAVLSTTQPPLQAIERTTVSALSGVAEIPVCYRIATECSLTDGSLAPVAGHRQHVGPRPPASRAARASRDR